MRIRKQWPDDAVLNDEDFLNTAKVADALAHPVRIRILRYILTENLARREVTNKDLVAAFDYAQATISQHISKLLIGGLIEMKKKRTSSCYYACIGKLTVFMDNLKKIDAEVETNELPDFLRTSFYDADESIVMLDDLDNERDNELDGDLDDEMLPGFFDDAIDDNMEGAPRFL